MRYRVVNKPVSEPLDQFVKGCLAQLVFPAGVGRRSNYFRQLPNICAGSRRGCTRAEPLEVP
jgi:hypothetical protein